MLFLPFYRGYNASGLDDTRLISITKKKKIFSICLFQQVSKIQKKNLCFTFFWRGEIIRKICSRPYFPEYKNGKIIPCLAG